MTPPTAGGGEPPGPVVSSRPPDGRTGSGSSSADLLEGAPPGRTSSWWASLSSRRRARLRIAGRLAVVLLLVGVSGAAGHAWWAERSLTEEVRVEASIGVFSSSNGPRSGEVGYYAVVRNAAPRPARLTDVRVAQSRLRVRGRPREEATVLPGRDIYVRLSVELDCGREEPVTTGSVLRGSVGVVTAGGTATRAPVDFVRADPLTYAAETLCGLDPHLRIADVSGHVSGALTERP